jgi:hypothetical protein
MFNTLTHFSFPNRMAQQKIADNSSTRNARKKGIIINTRAFFPPLSKSNFENLKRLGNAGKKKTEIFTLGLAIIQRRKESGKGIL